MNHTLSRRHFLRASGVTLALRSRIPAAAPLRRRGHDRGASHGLHLRSARSSHALPLPGTAGQGLCANALPRTARGVPQGFQPSSQGCPIPALDRAMIPSIASSRPRASRGARRIPQYHFARPVRRGEDRRPDALPEPVSVRRGFGLSWTRSGALVRQTFPRERVRAAVPGGQAGRGPGAGTAPARMG